MRNGTATSELIVAARGVWKVYRHGGQRRQEGGLVVEALKGVDFDVRRGEMVAIMGPSGCGKTTLLNCLSGIDTIDRGEIFIDGCRLQSMSDKELTRYRATSMGFVFQSFNLLPVLTAVENVEYPLLVTNVRPSQARRQAMEALASVGLADRAGHLPARLSGGQQQRVAVARAIVSGPAIVWADEPTGNLDSASAAALMGLLRQLNRTRGQTFVVVTHAAEIGEQTDRVVRMRDGRIEDAGSGALPASPSPERGEGPADVRG
jgi:ABC-type lipoprotein export system ATPase subunit